jgi:hypothetical protein
MIESHNAYIAFHRPRRQITDVLTVAQPAGDSGALIGGGVMPASPTQSRSPDSRREPQFSGSRSVRGWFNQERRSYGCEKKNVASAP